MNKAIDSSTITVAVAPQAHWGYTKLMTSLITGFAESSSLNGIRAATRVETIGFDSNTAIYNFFRELSFHLSSNTIEDPLDFTLDKLDSLIEKKSFLLCDSIMSKIDARILPNEILFATLSVTLPVKATLKGRNLLISKFKKKLETEIGTIRAELALRDLC